MDYFSFKQFTIFQDKCVFKVGTDGVLLGACADVSNTENILDIGTGTGLIALMLAQRCNARIVAIEPDSDSFEQASQNIKRSNWAGRIQVINTDLQNYYSRGVKFDLIVSNPPYFADSLKNPDRRKAVSRHNDSLTTRDLLDGTSGLMAGTGKLQVIMPYAEGNVFITEAVAYGLYCNNILKIRPLPTSAIRRLILTFSGQRTKTSESFLTIEHGKRHEFTEEYMYLTKDFYLKF